MINALGRAVNYSTHPTCKWAWLYCCIKQWHNENKHFLFTRCGSCLFWFVGFFFGWLVLCLVSLLLLFLEVFLFVFKNKCSKNTKRNLKGPAQHNLGKKTSLHLLQSIALISPAEGTLQDFPVSGALTIFSQIDLSPKSMLRNASQCSSISRAANLSEVIITSMSQAEGVEIFLLAKAEHRQEFAEPKQHLQNQI